ncbi:hypothetical protein [Leptospira sarikeiensis]|uniref:Uncharacterized protein n=1 Tax=Leptospira sarikeiensis TaxID=2484943 RepID=A0A4V3JRT9_9LEPT|nr:hypothetical protein [Leptospira sarikeiensis]TGL61701.1 hypothetical protein EHQ64_10065 [Leptospira sarikeiensis]
MDQEKENKKPNLSQEELRRAEIDRKVRGLAPEPVQSFDRPTKQQKSLEKEELTSQRIPENNPLLINSKKLILVMILAGFISIPFLRVPSLDQLKIPKSQILENVKVGINEHGGGGAAELRSIDFNINFEKDSTSEANIFVWDFADEDGDEIEILINGTSIVQDLQIKNEAKLFKIPVPSVVEVKGIKDGVGGISYAIQIQGKSTYFNLVEPGKINKYTLVKP